MIIGLIDHEQGTVDKVSFEMLTLARRLADKLNSSVNAVIIGGDAQSLTESLIPFGINKVCSVQHEGLDEYAPEAWAKSLVQLSDEFQPEAVIAPGTDRGNEVMAHFAARLSLPLATNCTSVEPGESYALTRVRWGGSLYEEASLEGSPKLLTVAPLAVAAEELASSWEAPIEVFTPSLDDKDFRVRVAARTQSETEGVSLADARIVVGGGRGVGSKEGFGVLDELAELLDGAVGSSRAATNLGWRAHADQIGQTGTRIAPDLYIACGISGAIQHMVGCKGANRVLAINTDPEAPIVAKANYAIIGDLHEVIPALISEIKKAKSG